MSGLKLGDSSLSMTKADVKLDKVRQSKKKRQAPKRLYEKTKPSSTLHELAKPSEKLILEKKRQINPELIPNQSKIPAHLRGELAKRDWLTPKTESPQSGQVVYRPLIELNAFVPQGDGVTADGVSTITEVSTNLVQNTTSQVNDTLNHVLNPFDWDVQDMAKPIQKKKLAKTMGRNGLRFVKGSASALSKSSDSDNDSDPAQQSFEMSQEICQESAYNIHSSVNKARLRVRAASIERATVREQFIHEHKMNYRLEKNQMKSSAEYSESNPLSKWQQRRKIKKKYAKEYRKRMKIGRKALRSQGNSYLERQAYVMAMRLREAIMTIFRAIASKPQIILFLLLGFLIMGMISVLSSTATMVMQAVVGGAFGSTSSSYTAEESDLLQVEANYKAKETALQSQIDNIESTMAGYDEYIYNLSEIGHDPHDLAALLTALYQAYTPSQVASKLDEIFNLQYTLTTVATEETRTRTVTNADGTTSTETYQWRILTVTLTNTNIHSLAADLLTDDEYEHYLVLRETKGNMPDLFGDYYGSGSSGGDLTYEIPDHYLSDDNFAALMEEAVKYLGYPYVWGGSTPTTSFDCSGFVCWVLRASGVWNISRTTAQGIFDQCITIPSSERQAGDIIFFTGTYASAGAVSHVGIYVGDGMMIHCGNPISYAPVDSGYWTSYFYAYGRIP